MSKKNKKINNSDLYIPAGLFIGMGLGFIVGNFVGYLLLGMGIGFLAMIFDEKFSEKNKS
ncbi:MAG: hypothetical protein VXZ40_03000 [Nanoarchaeota archaeon]|nr:hypothetical protein [Nanoarchaeota archaeon]